MQMLRAIGFMIALSMLSGCTVVEVREAQASQTIRSVVIVENKKVEVGDMLDVLTEGFARHGISSRIVKDEPSEVGLFVVTYTAHRNWDLALYLTEAEIWIRRDGQPVANGVFRLRGGGGLAVTKFNSTREKLNPVLDSMLKNYKTASVK